MLASRYLVAQFRNKVAKTLASLSVNYEEFEKNSSQPNILAVRMAMLVGKIIDENYDKWSEAEVKIAAKKFTELVDAGIRTAAKKSDGAYEPLYPEFSAWVLNTDFRFDATKRMFDYVKSVDFPTLKDGPVYENDYVKDCPPHPKVVASSIPPAVIAERIIVSLHKENQGDVQKAFDGYVNGGTWPYASDDQKKECARLMQAFGFAVTYKAKKEASKDVEADKKQEWISKKIEFLIKNEGLDQKQAAGKAYGMWESEHGKTAQKFPLSVDAQVGTAEVEIRNLTSPKPPTQTVANPEVPVGGKEDDLQLLIDKLTEADKTEAVMEKEGDSGIVTDEAEGDRNMPSPRKTDVHGNPNVGATDQTGKMDEKIRPMPSSMEPRRSMILARAKMLMEFMDVENEQEAKETVSKYAKKLATAAKISEADATKRICSNLEVFASADNESLEIYNRFYRSARIQKHYCSNDRCRKTTDHVELEGQPGKLKCKECGTEKDKVTKKSQHIPEASVIRAFEAALPQYNGGAFQRLQDLQMKVQTSNDPREIKEYENLADIWSGLHARGPVAAQAVTPVQQPMTAPAGAPQNPQQPQQPQNQMSDNDKKNMLSALQQAINQANQNNDQNSANQLTDVLNQKMQESSNATNPAFAPTASLKLVEEAAKRGEYLTVDEIFRISPIAAKQMKDAGLLKVKAEYLLKRVLPYLQEEDDGLTD